MARRARQNFPQTTRRQPTTWTRVVTTTVFTVAPLTKVLLGAIALSNPGIGETVRRTRGVMGVSSDQSGAYEEQFGAFGLIVVSDLALAAGAASIPGPGTDLGDDGWFVWQPICQASASAVASGGSTQYQFDSKAMRRVQEGFGIAMMVENVHPTFGLEFAFALSMLTSLS